jgi:hypothetical protein
VAKGLQRDGRREAFWREALARQRQSGLNVRRWCAGEEVPETAFYFWRRTIIRRDRDAAKAGMPAFVPVTVATRRSAERIVIRLRGGRMMRLPADMDLQRIAALVHAIENQPTDVEGVAS